MAIRVGTSGWVYKHWREVFYPKELRQADWFGYYARRFDTVEINNSFYRLPGDAAFESWREQAPPGFLYATKASRFLTHMKKLKDPEDPLQKFFDGAARLEETLGPVLYQLPPYWHVNLQRFEHFLSVLPRGHTHVVEFRDASWLIEDVFQMMEHYRVSHCIHDMHPLQIPARVTASPVYIRFHGGRTHRGNYRRSDLETWAGHIDAWHSQALDVFVYFNNDIEGYAPANAGTLKELLSL